MSNDAMVSIPEVPQEHNGFITKWRRRRAERLLNKIGATEVPPTPKGIVPYEKFCEKYPDMLPRTDGDPQKGEFRRLTDPEEIKKAIDASDGYEPMAFDGPFSIFVVHPIQRPDGSYGLYHQVDWKFAAEGRSGVVTIPVWTDDKGVKRIGLVKHFRPPVSGVDETGGWYAEVPRFSQRKDKTVRETITDEALKELNADVVGDVQRVDAPEDATHGIAMENSLSSQMNPVWFVEVKPRDENPSEQQEGINGRAFLTLEEYREALRNGSVEIDGQKCSTHEAHSFMALHFAEDKKLMTPSRGRAHQFFRNLLKK